MKSLGIGKVRDIYQASDDKYVIVTTDKISLFGTVLPKTVADKGKVLNTLSSFWFNYTKGIVPNHVISNDLKFMPSFFSKGGFEGRSMLVKKLKMLPFQFIVRGYMFGQLWDSYTEKGEFCGEKLRTGYQLADKLDKPIVTISSKDEDGSSEFLSMWRVADAIGLNLLGKINEICLALYESCCAYTVTRGIIIADTKFEFGQDENGKLTLADEICTPDSCRLWNASDYTSGETPKSYDKQLLRDWLMNNKNPKGEMQFDAIPDELYEKTSALYQECYRKLLS